MVFDVTRLRLDAALYEFAPPRQPGAKGRLRKKGDHLPSLAGHLALLCQKLHEIQCYQWVRRNRNTQKN
jgi:hypothetical protein